MQWSHNTFLWRFSSCNNATILFYWSHFFLFLCTYFFFFLHDQAPNGSFFSFPLLIYLHSLRYHWWRRALLHNYCSKRRTKENANIWILHRVEEPRDPVLYMIGCLTSDNTFFFPFLHSPHTFNLIYFCLILFSVNYLWKIFSLN